ncbi:hypothetical protein [Celerinatantimonas sp. MCCC 1A17872]|uniref:hypothetical protein n=1 Tax=Celerinatantimonas sp. MCCC 1A17872 TaxID=3177514 RepID=UPI0038C80004
MEQLPQLLAQKRALTAELTRLKDNFNLPTGGLTGLFLSGDFSKFKPMARIISDLFEVQDQITEVMAAQLAELAGK